MLDDPDRAFRFFQKGGDFFVVELVYKFQFNHDLLISPELPKGIHEHPLIKIEIGPLEDVVLVLEDVFQVVQVHRDFFGPVVVDYQVAGDLENPAVERARALNSGNFVPNPYENFGNQVLTR